jgi:hypothetical protein
VPVAATILDIHPRFLASRFPLPTSPPARCTLTIRAEVLIGEVGKHRTIWDTNEHFLTIGQI